MSSSSLKFNFSLVGKGSCTVKVTHSQGNVLYSNTITKENTRYLIDVSGITMGNSVTVSLSSSATDTNYQFKSHETPDGSTTKNPWSKSYTMYNDIHLGDLQAIFGLKPAASVVVTNATGGGTITGTVKQSGTTLKSFNIGSSKDSADTCGNLRGTYTVSVTASPSKNYKFKRWTDSNGISLGTSTTYTKTKSSDDGKFYIYANFEYDPVKYTVSVSSTVNANNQGGGSYVEGDSVKVSSSPYEATKYKFSYWTHTGLPPSTAQKVTDNPWTFTMPGNNVTVKANYVDQMYTVKFDGEPKTGKYDESYTIPSRDTKYGTKNINIHYNSNGATDKDVPKQVSYTQQFTGWSPYTPSGKFQGNVSFTSTYSSPIYQPVDVNPSMDYGSDPRKRGYTFVGWQPGPTTTTESMTETAEWQAKSYTVIFKLDNSTGYTNSVAYWEKGSNDQSDKSVTKTYGDSTRAISNIPYRYGYNFKGWSYAKGSSTYIGPGAVIPSDGSWYSDSNPDQIVLYSIWEPKKFNIKFEYFNWTNNSTINKTKITDSHTITIEDKLFRKDNTSKSDNTDWAILGWSEVAPGGKNWGYGNEISNYGCWNQWSESLDKVYSPQMPFTINPTTQINWDGKGVYKYNWLGDSATSLTVYCIKNITGKFVYLGSKWAKVGTMYVMTNNGWKIVSSPSVKTASGFKPEIGHTL